MKDVIRTLAIIVIGSSMIAACGPKSRFRAATSQLDFKTMGDRDSGGEDSSRTGTVRYGGRDVPFRTPAPPATESGKKLAESIKMLGALVFQPKEGEQPILVYLKLDDSERKLAFKKVGDSKQLQLENVFLKKDGQYVREEDSSVKIDANCSEGSENCTEMDLKINNEVDVSLHITVENRKTSKVSDEISDKISSLVDRDIKIQRSLAQVADKKFELMAIPSGSDLIILSHSSMMIESLGVIEAKNIERATFVAMDEKADQFKITFFGEKDERLGEVQFSLPAASPSPAPQACHQQDPTNQLVGSCAPAKDESGQKKNGEFIVTLKWNVDDQSQKAVLHHRTGDNGHPEVEIDFSKGAHSQTEKTGQTETKKHYSIKFSEDNGTPEIAITLSDQCCPAEF